MLFTRARSLGALPYVIGMGGLSFTGFVLLVILANVRSTVPVVAVPDADSIGYLDPMEYTEEYGIGVAKSFVEIYGTWSADTYREQMREASQYPAPSVRNRALDLWLSHADDIESTNGRQIATVDQVIVHDFHPDIGMSLIIDVTYEQYFSGLPYDPIGKRLTLVLANSQPRSDYPFCLSIIRVTEQQLTMEG